MTELVLACKRFVADRRAVTATEYGIIIAALAFVLVAIFTALGPKLAQVFTNVGTSM